MTRTICPECLAIRSDNVCPRCKVRTVSVGRNVEVPRKNASSGVWRKFISKELPEVRHDPEQQKMFRIINPKVTATEREKYWFGHDHLRNPLGRIVHFKTEEDSLENFSSRKMKMLRRTTEKELQDVKNEMFIVDDVVIEVPEKDNCLYIALAIGLKVVGAEEIDLPFLIRGLDSDTLRREGVSALPGTKYCDVPINIRKALLGLVTEIESKCTKIFKMFGVRSQWVLIVSTAYESEVRILAKNW